MLTLEDKIEELEGRIVDLHDDLKESERVKEILKKCLFNAKDLLDDAARSQKDAVEQIEDAEYEL